MEPLALALLGIILLSTTGALIAAAKEHLAMGAACWSIFTLTALIAALTLF